MHDQVIKTDTVAASRPKADPTKISANLSNGILTINALTAAGQPALYSGDALRARLQRHDNSVVDIPLINQNNGSYTATVQNIDPYEDSKITLLLENEFVASLPIPASQPRPDRTRSQLKVSIIIIYILFGVDFLR